MAQANFTPIQLYRSTTASAVPTSGNLADGELAINTNDGKLYYKDSGGTVQLIASKAGASGDVVGPASATDNAIVRFDGTTGKLVQNSVVTIADSTGDIAGAGSITSTSASGILTRAAATQDGVELIGRAGGSSSYKVTLTPATLGGNRTLTLPDTTGTVALTGSTVASFSAGSTGFTPNSATTGAVTLGGTLATTNGGTGLTSFTANQVFYASSTSAVAQSSNLLYSGTDLTVYGITVGRGAGAVATNTAVGGSALNNNTTGSYNQAVGVEALRYNTDGIANTALGAQAAITNTSGGRLVALGNSALYANTTGSYNTAVGVESLRSNTTASNNTAVGYQSLYANTTGDNNTGIGWKSLIANTTGIANSAVGLNSLFSNTTGSYNVAFGQQALNSNTTASNNTALGYASLYSNTTASNNTAVGYQAGYSNTTGANNQVFGYQALYSNQTGNNNAAFGTGALYANTGNDNAAFGSGVTAVSGGALNANTSGERNAAFGNGAAAANTTGNYNTAIGSLALRSNTTASNNTAVGYQAGYSNTTGTTNVFLGYQAGYANTASRNTFVGYQSGSSNTTGTLNTCVGETSGRDITTGQQNTLIGVFSGGNTTTGSYNTFVGQSCGYQVSTGSKNTIIGLYNGNQGGLDIRTASNYIVLSDGDGNPREYINNTGTATFTVDRTSSTNAVALVLSDGVTGAQTNGVYKAIRSQSNNGSSVSEIRFIETDGSNNNTAIAFATANTAGNLTEKMRVLNTGAILALSGASTTATGTGIGFPATQSASSNANTLDDYEEGTFTPTIATGSANVTYTQQSGDYTKVGRLVTFGISLVLNTVTSAGSGDFQIGGLPFASSSSDVNQTRLVCQTSSVNFDATAYQFYAYTPTTSSSVFRVLYSYDNGSWSVAQANNFVIAAGSIIVITGFYYTDT